MKTKNIFLTLLMCTIFFTVSTTIQAEETQNSLQKKIEERKAALEQKKEDKTKMIESLKEKAKTMTAVTKKGKVSSVTGKTFVMTTKENKTFTVDAESAQILRKMGGKGEVSEFTVGDEVNVVGTFTGEARTTIKAKMVRNTSIQRVKGTFMAKVISKGTDSMVIQPEKRANQTAKIAATTKLINRKQQKITFADIQVNDQIRIKGVWNKENNELISVEEVKDMTLPKQEKSTKQ